MARPVKAVVTQASPARAVPATQTYVAQQGNTVMVRNKTNGNIIPLSRKQAERFARNFPNEFQIL